MQATLSPDGTMTDAESLRYIAAWLDEHGAEDVSVVSPGAKPVVFLHSLAEMKRLFPGQEAKRKRSGNSWRYELTSDGICFVTNTYDSPVPECREESVTL